MTHRRPWQVWGAAVACALVVGSLVGWAADKPDLTGVWRLRPDLSEVPKKVGFDLGVQIGPDQGGQRGGQRAGSGGGGNAGGALLEPTRRYESEEDRRRVQEIVELVKHPTDLLTVAQTETEVAFTDAHGARHLFHPTGREELFDLASGPIRVLTRWDADRLTVQYQVEKDRQVRYTYALSGDRSQLVVQIQLEGVGGGDRPRYIYVRDGPR